MAIIKTVNLHDFREAFRARGRAEQFSYDGFKVLFDYLEEMSDPADPVELDVIALCCEFSEDTPEEIAEAYSIDLPEREGWMDDDDYSEAVKNAVLDYLDDNTFVCGVTDSGTIVYALF